LLIGCSAAALLDGFPEYTLEIELTQQQQWENCPTELWGENKSLHVVLDGPHNYPQIIALFKLKLTYFSRLSYLAYIFHFIHSCFY
jgi:hypothetical protein